MSESILRTADSPDRMSGHGVLARAKARAIFAQLRRSTSHSFQISLPGGEIVKFGDHEPRFTIMLKNDKGYKAMLSLSEIDICDAYLADDIDIGGDLFAALDLRAAVSDKHPLLDLYRRVIPKIFGQLKTDKKAISGHYEYADDFYLTFLDPTRTYSQAVYESDDEPLETAMRRKLDFAIESTQLGEGSRVLDVGGGWGAFTEYAGKRGINVTSLTISDSSQRCINKVISDNGLDCRVVKENCLEHETDSRYDAIVILGVMEHMPCYERVVRQFERLLKPGGFVYLDCSAAREKYAFNLFINRYIYPGNHCMFSIDDFLTEVQRSDLELLSVHNDRHSYYLTCKAWALNMEEHKEQIIDQWGMALFRKFKLYLSGVAHNLYTNKIQAYRLVLQLNPPS